jgi:hypothetical protein
MEGSHEIARTIQTPALSEHARETEIYSGKISDFQRPPDYTASNNNMFSGPPSVLDAHWRHPERLPSAGKWTQSKVKTVPFR